MDKIQNKPGWTEFSRREARESKRAKERARVRARKWAKTQGDSYIYVIASGPEGPVKVGLAIDPDRRLKEIQTGHPVRLAIFAERQVKASLVRQIEHECHVRLKDLRSNGEWFRIAAKRAEEVVDQVIATLGCETYK